MPLEEAGGELAEGERARRVLIVAVELCGERTKEDARCPWALSEEGGRDRQSGACFLSMLSDQPGAARTSASTPPPPAAYRQPADAEAPLAAHVEPKALHRHEELALLEEPRAVGVEPLEGLVEQPLLRVVRAA